MKITRRQLRKLILEEVDGLYPERGSKPTAEQMMMRIVEEDPENRAMGTYKASSSENRSIMLTRAASQARKNGGPGFENAKEVSPGGRKVLDLENGQKIAYVVVEK